MTRTKVDPRYAHKGLRMQEILDHLRAGRRVFIQKGLAMNDETGEHDVAPSLRHSPTVRANGSTVKLSRPALMNLLDRKAVQLVDQGTRLLAHIKDTKDGAKIVHDAEQNGWYEVMLCL